MGVARHFDDEDSQLPYGNSARSVLRSIKREVRAENAKYNLRCSEHKKEADACTLPKGHLELPDRVEWENEQYDVDRHARTV